jgi:hypothetical protein
LPSTENVKKWSIKLEKITEKKIYMKMLLITADQPSVRPMKRPYLLNDRMRRKMMIKTRGTTAAARHQRVPGTCDPMFRATIEPLIPILDPLKAAPNETSKLVFYQYARIPKVYLGYRRSQVRDVDERCLLLSDYKHTFRLQAKALVYSFSLSFAFWINNPPPSC